MSWSTDRLDDILNWRSIPYWLRSRTNRRTAYSWLRCDTKADEEGWEDLARSFFWEETW